MKKIQYISYNILWLCLLGSFSAIAQFADASVLNDGIIYKMGIEKTGVYRLSYEWLKSRLGNDFASIVSPRQIKIYGNGDGMLPELIATPRVDDLQENTVQIVGGEDGRFDAGDYILFYAENADQQIYNINDKLFTLQKNTFDNYNYYFLKISDESNRKIEQQESLENTTYTTSTFDEVIHFEEEKLNLLDAFNQAQGSGKRWYGDLFKNQKSYTYDFDVPNRVTTEKIKIKAVLAARNRSNSNFNINVEGTTLVSSSITNTNSSFSEPSEAQYANIGILKGEFAATQDKVSIKVNYPGEEGWLDYITLNARRKLVLGNQQLRFRDAQSINFASTTFELQGTTKDLEIWDVTQPLSAVRQAFSSIGNTIRFGVPTSSIKEFVAFTPEQAFEPVSIEKIANQNIHGLQELDMVIVFHPLFRAQAARLAEHRNTYSKFNVDTVNIFALYNEFSSGRQDPTAIRDFARMMHKKYPRFKYLLLFGDGSFDYRNIGKRGGNFIPVYETDDSESPITAFPSDDYFVLLGDNEGFDLRGDIDIAVGRLPVKTALEARQVTDKIIRYDTSVNTFGDWRKRVAFVADDEDRNLHVKDTDRIADTLFSNHPVFNQEKIYLDAFPQQSTSGGQGFPLATEAIEQALFRGVLAINYLGHGGSQGWAQERVLDKNRGDIRNWNNADRLPVFITATCSFSGYDDPNQVTAGEEVLLTPNGGGIALLTTVRAVFASSNATLIRAVFDTMFQNVEGRRPTLGEIIISAKNGSSVGRSENSRKFTLLGDPAQPLALPLYRVATTHINQQPVETAGTDTLSALERVVVEGEIRDEDENLATWFNGDLVTTIFDKAIKYSTLAQDASSEKLNFRLQKNVIFKGNASVKSGRFRLEFVVPKDINFEFGEGKFSFYAKDLTNKVDASGYYDNIIIGGTYQQAQVDQQGPKVEVFMNNENFVFGGNTNPNPILLVKLEDDNGINVTGNSIGHDLEAVLDEDTKNTYLLNDYYQSELDNYQKGTVRFPLSNLAEGLHSIRVKAWDVANNPAEGFTEFVVAENAKSALRQVMNFPNPFYDFTCFTFEHDFVNESLEVQIEIFSVDGKLVKSIQESIFANDFSVTQENCIRWDGKSDSGLDLGKGIYLYRVKLYPSTSNGEALQESNLEKLVIIK